MLDLNSFSHIGDPVLIISHPRSGTHLSIDLIRKQFPAFRSYKHPLEPQHYLYLSIEGFLSKKGPLSQKRALAIVRRANRPLVKMHTYSYPALTAGFPEWMQWIEERGKTIYVVRDVREVLCSYYIYARAFEKSARVEITDFLRQTYCGRKNRPVYWSELTNTWMSKPNVMILQYENILKDTARSIQQIGDFIRETPLMHSPLLPKKVRNIWQFRWQRLVSTNPECSAVLGSARGEKLNWREVLSDKDLEFIEQEAGETMRRLGYL